jgi:predicted HAD superfamily Cof-like phosphohydrolase
MVALVTAMHDKFGLNYPGPVTALSPQEWSFRVTCLREEIQEFVDATTRADAFDALLDLMVFTIGTMLRMGLPIDEGFRRVMAANMQKEVAMVKTASKRDFELDLIKPKGWTAPDLSDLTGDQHAPK